MALIVLIMLLLLTESALAQYRTVTVSYQKGAQTISKLITCKGDVPGTLKGNRFTTFKKKVQQLKAKGISGGRLATAKSLLKAGRPACSQSSGTPGVNGNFDGWGNVTDRGKIAFQIPTWIDANISDGRAVHERFCTDCHAERLNYIFPEIRERTAMAPMLFTVEELTNQDVANLTAFYNRFNP